MVDKKKTVFMFPGQGSQYVGMAQGAYEKNENARNIIERAGDIIGEDIKSIMFNGPKEILTESKNAQASILIHSFINYKALSGSITPDFTCGHSLGEYSALVASGVISFDNALKLVRKRGMLMSEAGKKAPGTMAAVIGMDAEDIEEIVSENDNVVVANYNGSAQTVISGTVEGIDEITEQLDKAGARRIVKLNVSGAFHSPLMKYAFDEFSGYIDDFDFNEPETPVILNVTGTVVTSASKIKNNLKKQIISPVKWTDTLKTLIENNVELYCEAGPGRVLSSMAKRAVKNGEIMNFDKYEDIEQWRNDDK